MCAGNKLIGLGEVQTLLSERDGIFIDTRTEEEFSGQFLFGNARGGSFQVIAFSDDPI